MFSKSSSGSKSNISGSKEELDEEVMDEKQGSIILGIISQLTKGFVL
jgi:hypothetical protein